MRPIGHVRSALAGIVWLIALLWVAPAFAHAALVGSQPPDGAVLAAAPEQIILTFSEPTSALAMQIVDASGARTSIEGDEIASEGNRIVLSLPSPLGEGTHVLAWRAASSDGHPISGTVIFSIGAPSETGPAEEPKADFAARALLWLARATMLATLLVGAGSSGFRMVATALPTGARRGAIAAIIVGAIAAIASVPLNGLDALGRPLGDIAAREVWAVTMTSGYGATVIVALVAMAIASVAVVARKANLAGWIAVLSLTAIGLAATLSGHASSADPRWLTRTMVFVHVATIAWWAGELLPLALILRQSHAVSNPPLMRFSRFIPFVIAPLVVSGVTLAVIQLGPPSDAWWSPYTYLFVAKLLLLLILFTIAAWNRWHLTARVVAGQEAATRHLRSAIVLEIVLIVIIVGVAAGWRFTPPPRSIAAAELASQAQATLDFAKGGFSGEVAVKPARVGENTVTVILRKQDGTPAEFRSIRVFLSNGALGIDKLELTGAATPPGAWRAENAVLPAAGEWTIVVEVRISDFEQVRASAALAIGG